MYLQKKELKGVFIHLFFRDYILGQIYGLEREVQFSIASEGVAACDALYFP